MNDDYQTPGRDSIETDAALGDVLGRLDPGRDDAGYWPRFHAAVMRAARDELARRRMLADVTVSELVASWGRTLVPAAVLAASVAVFLVTRPSQVTTPPDQGGSVALEEMLDGVEWERSAVGAGTAAVTFAAEGF